MKRLWTACFTVLLTLALLMAAAYALAQREKSTANVTVPIPEENQTEYIVPESTVVKTETFKETVPVQTVLAEEETVAEMPRYDSVPQYFQTDYPHIAYGNGTIATSGCSMTCLAMAATYLLEHPYYPDDLAYHFGSYGKNNIERLEYGNEQLSLPNTRTENVQDALKAVRDGKIVIAMMDEESLFTDAQHFILWAGRTEDGKIQIHDPYEPNYSEDVYLSNCFRDGFSEYDLLHGFSGAWIYDKAQIPENADLFDATRPQQQENRYTGYELTEEDIYILASFAWVHARNESEEVQQAVIEVVLNRVISDQFPDTVHDVIWKSELYDAVESIERAQTDYPQYRAVTAAMYGPYILPENVCYFSKWETGGNVWGELGSFCFRYE